MTTMMMHTLFYEDFFSLYSILILSLSCFGFHIRRTKRLL